jgi:hypothetical protein
MDDRSIVRPVYDVSSCTFYYRVTKNNFNLGGMAVTFRAVILKQQINPEQYLRVIYLMHSVVSLNNDPHKVMLISRQVENVFSYSLISTRSLERHTFVLYGLL